MMEEKFCHGEAMETLIDSLGDNMLGGDFSLKIKSKKKEICTMKRNHL
jgi:hypothetical protein